MKTVLAVVLLLTGVPVLADPFEESIVQVVSYIQSTDFDSPWRRADTKPNYHLGTLVEGRYILVSALAVAEARHIEMNRVGSARKFPLNIAFVDYVANLALLKPEEDEALKGMRPLGLGGMLRPGDQAVVVAGNRGDRLVQLAARLKEVEMRRGGTSQYSMPHYDFEVRQTSGLGWSEPIIERSRLVGLAVGQTTASLYVLPAKVIRHFLSDHAGGSYRGFSRLGIYVRPLTSPAARAWLEAGKETRGVFVSDVAVTSPYFGKLLPKDILVEMGGIDISDNGSYRHSHWGRMPFTERLTDYFAGDELVLKVLRGGKELTFREKLKRYEPKEDFIPEIFDDLQRHLVFGGLLFQEMSKNFLESWGKDWTSSAPDHMLFAWNYLNQPPANSGERIVVLNRVLADEFNKGYEKITNVQLHEVNGMKVTSLESLRSALSNPVKRGAENFAVFKFGHGAGTVVLGYRGLAEAHDRIARYFGVKGGATFFQP